MNQYIIDSHSNKSIFSGTKKSNHDNSTYERLDITMQIVYLTRMWTLQQFHYSNKVRYLTS